MYFWLGETRTQSSERTNKEILPLVMPFPIGIIFIRGNWAWPRDPLAMPVAGFLIRDRTKSSKRIASEFSFDVIFPRWNWGPWLLSTFDYVNALYDNFPSGRIPVSSEKWNAIPSPPPPPPPPWFPLKFHGQQGNLVWISMYNARESASPVICVGHPMVSRRTNSWRHCKLSGWPVRLPRQTTRWGIITGPLAPNGKTLLLCCSST